MAQPSTLTSSRRGSAATASQHPLLPSLLSAVIASEPLPDWSAAQWLAVLRAPQASARVSRSAAERGMAGAALIERAEVARLLRWVSTTWPGSLAALAGALAGARRVQAAGPDDLDAAAAYVVQEIRRARSRRDRRPRKGWRVLPLDPAELRAIEPPPTPAAAPSRVVDALEWMLGYVERTVHLPMASALDIEASLSVFVGWYVDRLGSPPDGPQIVPTPPTRPRSPKQRLSARLADREMVLLLAGPPGSRGCPAERAWQRGMGYWAIAALLCWARGAEPPEPTAEAREWWSTGLRALGGRAPRLPASAAPACSAPHAGQQAM